MQEIERKSDYIFVFSDNSEKMINKKIDLKANKENMVDLLESLLSNTGLAYKILDKQIIYSTKSLQLQPWNRQPLHSSLRKNK